MGDFMLYIAELHYIVEVVAQISGRLPTDVQVWTCPCGTPDCKTQVAYARETTQGDAIWFQSTVTFQSAPPYPTFAIENVEDIEPLLETMPPDDAIMYACWLNVGLREALLNARRSTDG
jgi:hypothetical protein